MESAMPTISAEHRAEADELVESLLLEHCAEQYFIQNPHLIDTYLEPETSLIGASTGDGAAAAEEDRLIDELAEIRGEALALLEEVHLRDTSEYPGVYGLDAIGQEFGQRSEVWQRDYALLENRFTEAISAAARKVRAAASAAGRAIVKGAKAAGQGIVKGARTVKDAAKNAVNATGNAIKRGAAKARVSRDNLKSRILTTRRKISSKRARRRAEKKGMFKTRRNTPKPASGSSSSRVTTRSSSDSGGGGSDSPRSSDASSDDESPRPSRSAQREAKKQRDADERARRKKEAEAQREAKKQRDADERARRKKEAEAQRQAERAQREAEKQRDADEWARRKEEAEAQRQAKQDEQRQEQEHQAELQRLKNEAAAAARREQERQAEIERQTRAIRAEELRRRELQAVRPVSPPGSPTFKEKLKEVKARKRQQQLPGYAQDSPAPAPVAPSSVSPNPTVQQEQLRTEEDRLNARIVNRLKQLDEYKAQIEKLKKDTVIDEKEKERKLDELNRYLAAAKVSYDRARQKLGQIRPQTSMSTTIFWK
jgi:hypothetical protein